LSIGFVRAWCAGQRSLSNSNHSIPIRMLTDYHTHTPLFLHAEGHPREYVRQAREVGLAEIGLSDHNPMPQHFDDWRMPMADFPKYLDIVEEARTENPDFPIRLALECDYIVGHEKWLEKTASLADWDYLIGSVHYITDEFAVDDPKHLSRWKGQGAVEEIWAMYWKLYEKNIRSGFFDFFAHPDLPKKFGFRPEGDLRHYYEPCIQALVDTKGVLEVSTAGLRKEVAEIYPGREMLVMAFAAGIPIVINSDAHKPSEVGQDFDQALRLVRGVGYRSTMRFARRQRIEVPLPETWPPS
jgi:histidinol-phosphatase (PHP family)